MQELKNQEKMSRTNKKEKVYKSLLNELNILATKKIAVLFINIDRQLL